MFQIALDDRICFKLTWMTEIGFDDRICSKLGWMTEIDLDERICSKLSWMIEYVLNWLGGVNCKLSVMYESVTNNCGCHVQLRFAVYVRYGCKYTSASNIIHSLH